MLRASAGKNFVDFDEDLQLEDLFNAAQEGFDSIELLKRYYHGRHGSEPGQAFQHARGARAGEDPRRSRSSRSVPPRRGRFSTRCRWRTWRGEAFTPMRRTPLHSRHDALGAVLMQAGNWLRPEFYAQAGKSKSECVREEVRAVRSRLGSIDVGTLGKIDLFGAGCGRFPRACLHGEVCQSEGRHDALRRDARREREW